MAGQLSIARSSFERGIAALSISMVAVLAVLVLTRSVLASAPPVTPAPPQVTDLGSGVAEVMWTDVDQEDGYDVQREKQKANGSWFKTTIVATVGTDVTSIEDEAGTDTFRYRVRAFNAAGDSGWSGWTEITLVESGGGGDPPADIWLAWYVYGQAFVPIAPVVENMGPEFSCVINGGAGAPHILHLLTNESGGHFAQGGWPSYGGDWPWCENCGDCGVTVTPTDVCANGSATYAIDLGYAFHLTSDGTGNIWFDFRGSGDPPGPKKEKRFQSEIVPVVDIIWDDPSDMPNSAFTLVISAPCLLLDTQTGPSDPRYISIDGVRFEKWTAP